MNGAVTKNRWAKLYTMSRSSSFQYRKEWPFELAPGLFMSETQTRASVVAVLPCTS